MLKRRGCQSVSQFAPQLPTRNKRVKVARRRRRRLSRTFSFRNAVNTKRGRFASWSMQIGGGEKRGLIYFRGTDCATAISSQLPVIHQSRIHPVALKSNSKPQFPPQSISPYRTQGLTVYVASFRPYSGRKRTDGRGGYKKTFAFASALLIASTYLLERCVHAYLVGWDIDGRRERGRGEREGE